MPNIVVRLPEGVLDNATKMQLVHGINAAAARAEQIADTPHSRAMCWVLVEETKPGNFTCGGADPTGAVVPVMIQTFVPAGVLDAQAHGLYAQSVQAAVASALRDERRNVLVSSFVTEVPDGHWGINGATWRLADFAQRAGYAHLRPVAA